jgi:hypothetical protein
MSLAKQIAIAILATGVLVAVGIGSYVISTQVIPDPTVDSGNNQNGNQNDNGNTITTEVVQKIAPTNIVMKRDKNDIVIQFDTAEKVGAVLYFTTEKGEKITQVVKDFSNGVPVKGVFYNLTPEETASTAHLVKISDPDKKIKTGERYYYIILMYKGARIPYGSPMDYAKGPTDPYILTIE